MQIRTLAAFVLCAFGAEGRLHKDVQIVKNIEVTKKVDLNQRGIFIGAKPRDGKDRRLAGESKIDLAGRLAPPALVLSTDCAKSDSACGTSRDTPCLLQVDGADQGFAIDDIVIMEYTQPEYAGSVTCTSDPCAAYTSPQVYFKVDDIAGATGTAKIGPTAMEAVCTAMCGKSGGEFGEFAGVCQAAVGTCTFAGATLCNTPDDNVGTATLTLDVVGTRVNVDCAGIDTPGCGASRARPCEISLHSTEGFAIDDTVVMTYTQAAATGESSCSGSACVEYISTDVFYHVKDLSASEAQAGMAETAFLSSCATPCAASDTDTTFSGYCQATAGDCTDGLATTCAGSTVPAGVVSFVLDPKPSDTQLYVTCGGLEVTDCGDSDFNPCGITVSSASGFVKDDILEVTYVQSQIDSEPVCSSDTCDAYTSSAGYFRVLDVTAGLDTAIIADGALKPICAAACKPTASDDYFSGICQATANDCSHGEATTCTGSSRPVGHATFTKVPAPAAPEAALEVDCTLVDDAGCGATVDAPCNIRMPDGHAAVLGDVFTLKYSQNRVDAEPLCTDSICYPYLVDGLFVQATDSTSGQAGVAVLSRFAFAEVCEAACANELPLMTFSGVCQADAARCTDQNPDECIGSAQPIGGVDFTPVVVAKTSLQVDCSLTAETGCGLDETTPCAVSLHSAAGFEVDDLVVITYAQRAMTDHATCAGGECAAVEGTLITKVTDVKAAELTAVIGISGVDHACPAACKSSAGAFSEICQPLEADCANGLATTCDATEDFIGTVTLELFDPDDPPVKSSEAPDTTTVTTSDAWSVARSAAMAGFGVWVMFA